MATTKKTVKKPAAKKPAAKTAAAKKPAAKKPAAKTAAAKKPAVKKTAAKTAAKKPAIKKAADKVVKKVSTVKSAVKTTAKKAVSKPAAKVSAVKSAVKTTAKKAVSKPAAKVSAITSAVKKPIAAAKGAAANIVNKPAATEVKSLDLFTAFTQSKLPREQGYIISSFFSPNTAYAIYEVISYAGVKEIFPTSDGLTFVSGGKKLFVLIEPATYHKKFEEPVSRAQGESIPKRFSELDKIIAKNQTTIFIAKDPEEIQGSFTILKPQNINFSVVFYELPDMYETISSFFKTSLNRQRNVPERDAKNAAEMVVNTIKKKMGFAAEE